jgi:surface antigen
LYQSEARMFAKTVRTAAAALALICSTAALSQVNFGFLNNSSLANLTSEDAVMLREALQSALRSEESGSVFDWNNPASGARGLVRMRQAYQLQDAQCRVVEIVTTARYRTFRDTYNLCQNPNGAWMPTGG